MNIFKKKLEAKTRPSLPIEPIDLYQSLYHKEGYSYLRGIQEEVLSIWHSRREEKEVLCKMNTGSGKTLVSLLMLYSKMIEGVGTAVYVCPDNYLLEQAKRQADLYDIPVCEISSTNSFPPDFLNCKSILLCNFHKLFNAKSIFNRDRIEIGALVIDDAHTCLDIARQNTTVKFASDHSIFPRIIKLFHDDLKRQAPGTFLSITEGDPQARILKVPYWAWFKRMDEMLNILSEFTNDDELKFKWQLINDSLDSYDCYIGTNGIEICPMIVPYQSIQSFSEAKFKYILSATFEDQIDLIKDFGISQDSVKNAIIPKNRKDVGQRLILAPRRFDPKIKDEEIRELCKEFAEQGHNVVVLVPSFDKANVWLELGAQNLSDNNQMAQNIENLKKSKGGVYVLVNRYDGVDLSGDMCRLLVLDGYPRFNTYNDLYKELRVESIQASLKAQIIDQGLGRAVRSGSDYCAVLLLGNELVQFLGNKSHYGYFSSVSRKQIEAGLELLDDTEVQTDSLTTIKDTISLCLTQNEDWREFHKSIIAEIDEESISDVKLRDLQIAQAEKNAVDSFKLGSYGSATEIINKEIINNDNLKLNMKHKGWYYEYSAKLGFKIDPIASNDMQLKANMVPFMLKPKNGDGYSRLSRNEEQASGILNYIEKFGLSHDLKIFLQDVMDDLTFSKDIKARKFEKALETLGHLLGFSAHSPEEEYGNGSDVLWIMSDNHYLILEAKSMAIHNEITRDNIGQLLQSGEWFKKQYGATANHSLVTLQSPTFKGWNVNPSENCKVINEQALSELKSSVEQFYDSIIHAGIHAVTKERVGKLITAHELTPENFRRKFLKDIKVK